MVCVSHADPIKLAIAHFLGMPLDAYQRLSVGLASINAIHLDHHSVRLVALNYSPTLLDVPEK